MEALQAATGWRFGRSIPSPADKGSKAQPQPLAIFRAFYLLVSSGAKLICIGDVEV